MFKRRSLVRMPNRYERLQDKIECAINEHMQIYLRCLKDGNKKGMEIQLEGAKFLAHSARIEVPTYGWNFKGDLPIGVALEILRKDSKPLITVVYSTTEEFFNSVIAWRIKE